MKGGPSRARIALLFVALAALGATTYHSHWSPDGPTYRLPVHMDEYVHWGYAQAISRAGSLDLPDPFTGSADEFSLASDLHERGFQAYLAAFQDLTNLPWPTVIELAPIAIALFLGLAVFALLERWGAGVEGVVWLIAIPSSLRFLGPSFLAPIMLAMPLVVAGAIVLFRSEVRHKAPLVGLLIAGLWVIHSMGAIVLTGMAILYGASALLAREHGGATLIAISAAPMVLAFPYADRIFAKGTEASTLPGGIETIRLPGVALFLSAALGAALLAASTDRSARRAGMCLGAAWIGAAIVLVFRLTADQDAFLLFDRSVMVAFVLSAMLAGVAWAGLRRGLARVAPRKSGAIVALALATAMLLPVTGAAARNLDQEYYRIAEPEQWEDWVATAPMLGAEHQLAIVDGRGTMPFSIATGRPTVYAALPTSGPPPGFVSQFFEQGASDTYLLVETGATIVVTDRPVDNPDLVRFSRTVYALRADYSQALAASRP